MQWTGLDGACEACNELIGLINQSITQEKRLSVEGWHFVIPDRKTQRALKNNNIPIHCTAKVFYPRRLTVNSDACHQGAGGGIASCSRMSTVRQVDVGKWKGEPYIYPAPIEVQ